MCGHRLYNLPIGDYCQPVALWLNTPYNLSDGSIGPPFLMNRFLGTDRIYQKTIGSHGAEVLLLALVCLLLAVLAVLGIDRAFNPLFNHDWRSILYPVATLIWLVLYVRGLARKIVVHRIFKSRHYLGEIDLDNQSPGGSRAGVSILREEAKADTRGKLSAASLKARVLEEGESWWLYDATSIIHSDKGMPVAERCYTVFEAKLRQITPHLVFDGKAAKGRQFKSVYSKSQQLKGIFGTGFDRLFAAYSPAHHTIETLSFITPEVIEAVGVMGDCDLEFVDNSLLCYTSFLGPNHLEDFRRRCFNLHAKVNDNLRLYKPKGTEIKPFGRRLLKSYRRHLVVGSLLIGWGGALFVLLAVNDNPDAGDTIQLFVQAIVIGGLGLASLVWGLRGRRRNRRLEREFLGSAG